MHSILCAPHILVCTLSLRESLPLRVENVEDQPGRYPLEKTAMAGTRKGPGPEGPALA
jgi:hypothetical protein